MSSELGLLTNLIMAGGAAFLCALIAVRLHQSAILGYLAAGIVIGPFSPGLVGDISTVEQMAEVGIILLMFSVGLQVSFRDLLSSGFAVLVGAPVQIAVLVSLGYLGGAALGWLPLQSFLLGAVVAISSSAVLTKTLSDRAELDTQHGRVALAWSAVQDLATVLLVILLSVLATGGTSPLMEAALTIGRAGLFLLGVGPVAYLVLPRLFERVASLHSRELFILMVATVALGTAYASTFFGLSLALGAFVAGVVVAESDLSHHILGEITPIRDIFAALFFVSVGMLIDPRTLWQSPVAVLLTIGLIVVAKGSLTALLVRVFGYPLRVALLSGVTLANAGEFSFVLATQGTTLGILPPQVFSLMLLGVAATMAITPPLLEVASRWAHRLPQRMPSLASNGGSQDGFKQLKGHAVICGYGRVGRVIAGALAQRGFPFVVIDEDPRIVRRLRQQGVDALPGNAANPALLERVNLARARVLVVALPDSVAARQIVDFGREANPDLDIVVRTHSWRERDFLQERGIGEAVMGELELALEMTRHTLHRLGVATLEAQATVQRLRRRVEMEPYSDLLEGESSGG